MIDSPAFVARKIKSVKTVKLQLGLAQAWVQSGQKNSGSKVSEVGKSPSWEKSW